jgi:hypothetical protein
LGEIIFLSRGVLRRQQKKTEGRYKIRKKKLVRSQCGLSDVAGKSLTDKYSRYEGVSKIFPTGAAIYTAVVVARSTGIL